MSDFDKEAERERLREKYEKDKRNRETTERMSELLLKGATMTNAHCGECGDPIFRYDGQEFCPTCQKPVTEADEAGAADPATGEDGAGEPAETDSEQADAAAGEHDPAAASAEGEERPSADEQTEERPSADEQTEERPSADERSVADERPAAEKGATTDERAATGEHPPADDRSPADERAATGESADTTDRQTADTAESGAPATDESRPQAVSARGSLPAETGERAPVPRREREATGRREPEQHDSGGDLAAARESLTRTLVRFAREAESAEDPRRAREYLEAANEAAAALANLSEIR